MVDHWTSPSALQTPPDLYYPGVDGVSLFRSGLIETATLRYEIVEPAEYGTRNCPVHKPVNCSSNDRTNTWARIVARIYGGREFKESTAVTRPDQVCRSNDKDRSAPKQRGCNR
jgi:hypothetical protein